MQTKIKLHFSRFEFKYILPKSLRDEIEREVLFFMSLDPYTEGHPDKKYEVRSLYFEDMVYSNYYEKIDGMESRAKFRIRTYSLDPETHSHIFLEMKCRKNAMVYKHRVPINGDVYEILKTARGDDLTNLVLKGADPGNVLEKFHFECERKRLRPIMLIDYTRRPYISKYDPEFRLTFDDYLASLQSSSMFPSHQWNGMALLKGYTILEVKFRFHIPSWFHRILQSYELNRVSISKICNGIEAWKLTPHLE